ncbi:MAG TPA: PP2C family protein-serine/threonine phosphatase [Bryobacteraceae bacterium]|nr:PP2C family protein-serine/threonine phosphatase [Bryobacteraceae bacterium]
MSFALYLAMGLLLPATNAPANTTQAIGPSSVTLGGLWQFHTGDDPLWSAPGYDDSGWEKVSADKPWRAQGHVNYTGFAWYRRRIAIGMYPGSPKLGILIPNADDEYQLYWNGREIGNYGTPPPHPSWYHRPRAASFSLPEPTSSSLEGVLALRVWERPFDTSSPDISGGLSAPPLIGDARALNAQVEAAQGALVQANLPNLLIGAIMIATGLLALVFYARGRNDKVYLWCGLYLVGVGSSIWLTFTEPWKVYQLFGSIEQILRDVPLWLLLLGLFNLENDVGWRKWTARLVTAYVAAQVIDIGLLMLWDQAGPGFMWVDAMTTVVYTVAALYPAVLLSVLLVRRQHIPNLPVALLAAFYTLYYAAIEIFLQGRRFTHSNLTDVLYELGVNIGSYHFTVLFILQTLLFLAIVYGVGQRIVDLRRRQIQMELELKSAGEVQQVLFPEELPAIPGFKIASAYKPAADVGGDFFQILPASEGGVLIILGDVSGKGLRAAMTVSLVVGTLRTLAEFTQEPAELLRGLNHRLSGRGDGTFATCLALRIRTDGRATVANAGHLAPYLRGREIGVPGALPLGVLEHAEYEVTSFRLNDDETLTLLTDGVVEARNRRGELYGFERTSTLVAAHAPPERIVETVCRFGQEDDVTIVSVTKLAIGVQAQPVSLNLFAV